MEKGLEVSFKCIECEESFKANANNVKVMEAEYDDSKLQIVYVDCPKCNKRHFVQIDDDRTSKLKARNFIMFKRLAKKKLSGKKIGKQENLAFKNLADTLLELRADLMKEYEGRTVTNTLTGEPELIHFTIC